MKAYHPPHRRTRTPFSHMNILPYVLYFTIFSCKDFLLPESRKHKADKRMSFRLPAKVNPQASQSRDARFCVSQARIARKSLHFIAVTDCTCLPGRRKILRLYSGKIAHKISILLLLHIADICPGDAKYCVSTGWRHHIYILTPLYRHICIAAAAGSCRHTRNTVSASHPDAERMGARAIFLCRSVTGKCHRRRGSLRNGECPFPHVAVIPP